jgi:glycosyltransferase involved in cell wall biosynthesis
MCCRRPAREIDVRIAFLLTQSLDSPSGLGRYWPLSKEMARLGHEVTVLALHPDYNSLGSRAYSAEGVNIRYVGQMHVIKRGSVKSHFHPLRLIQVAAVATWRLAQAALAVPADLYHVGKPHPMNATAGWLASRLRGARLYVDCDDYEAASSRYSMGWQRPMVRWFEDWLPRRVDGVTTNTRFTQDRLQRLGIPADRIVYVPNGVDVARFTDQEGPQAHELRRQLDLSERSVVLYLGNLSLASHPVDLLIDAFARVHQQRPEAILLLVGGGDDLATLQDQVERLGLHAVVRFVGQVSPTEAVGMLRIADVSIDPVRADPVASARSPLKVVESMMVGVPVVTGDLGDRRAVLDNGRAGLLVEPGSAEALAEAILSVLADPALARSLSAAGRERAELYHWERLVHEFVRVYEC